MTPEAQRIAIAEACGWSDIQEAPENLLTLRFKCFTNDPNMMPPDEIQPGSLIGRHKQEAKLSLLPDYLNDLNAMHEAERVLTPDQWYDYVAHLTHDIAGPYSYVRATAAQRAEAFLRTLSLWRDET